MTDAARHHYVTNSVPDLGATEEDQPLARVIDLTERSAPPVPNRSMPCWMPAGVVLVAAVALLTVALLAGPGWARVGSTWWWLLTLAGHVPLALLVAFLTAGVVERLAFLRRGRVPAAPGRMPAFYPKVCVQLPMFNEHTVARRVIEAAAMMTWPTDRIQIQVLDDSTDDDTRALVERVCAEVRMSGIDCFVRHRVDRQGYKAGALEAGRRETDAKFIAIFDADFVPPRDFLLRTIPHFFDAERNSHDDLAPGAGSVGSHQP